VTKAQEFRTGKGHRDENFPVASRLIPARHRPAILAFYEFVRTADDIADHPSLAAEEKIELLDGLDADLVGSGDGNSPQATALRDALAERGLSPEHARDLLKAFRLDATKKRYVDWDDLIGYCAYSAMPVGRFVLDVHGESRTTWPASDSICAALQIINHIQDCADDYRKLDRVYLPLDALAASGTGVEALAAAKASPALRQCLAGLAQRTRTLLCEGEALPVMVKDFRLGLEIAVISGLAYRLTGVIAAHDPLSERVHFGKAQMVAISLLAILTGSVRRVMRRPPLAVPAVRR
jgi:hydroxysqualene synthase